MVKKNDYSDKQEKEWKNYYTNPEKGTMLDFIFGWRDPYVTLRRNWITNDWESYDVDNPYYQIGSCNPKKTATMSDNPSLLRHKKGLMIFMAETCAFCFDTQEVLGCVTWGFSLNGQTDELIQPIDKGASLEASDIFKTAAAKWNEAARAENEGKSLLYEPLNPRSTFNMGGSSALPSLPNPKNIP